MQPLPDFVENEERPREDHFVRLHNVTWEDYERLLEIRGEDAGPRLTFLEGELEIMTPSRQHESIKSVIGRLVEVWCLEHDIDFSAYGSWTLKDRAVERGLEPDECYVFSRVAEPERPDLAIEVVWTSGGMNKLEVYRELGVKEIWYYRRGRIQPYVLRDRKYQAVDGSEVLAGLDLQLLCQFLDRPTTSQAIREYRAALRSR